MSFTLNTVPVKMAGISRINFPVLSTSNALAQEMAVEAMRSGIKTQTDRFALTGKHAGDPDFHMHLATRDDNDNQQDSLLAFGIAEVQRVQGITDLPQRVPTGLVVPDDEALDVLKRAWQS